MDKQLFKAAAGLPQPMADRWWPHVSAAWQEFDILTAARQAAWIAQVGHESGGFVFTRELWGPTPAQLRYEGRADLGNTQPGDGKRFMGRGLIQITGRANYRACGEALGYDLVSAPVALESDDLAARSACWFWHLKDLSALTDAGEFVRLTRRINGGTNGLADRQERWGRARRALSLQ
ncbi:glycoside hydrolase family 19 protein [Cupriavidus campinensis]|uniref:Glycoside hydrolase family 19 protein n=1 Tax=Cupriavidus campinensis TaxID=151783 RepID=A0AAE9HVM0_9BURK|nr:glycoside hydrolase family 19 protein [Cupriavidus campinensis]URF02778.1 glycoside hydrolase family 19 protein [Cupriavidus campinensis]